MVALPTELSALTLSRLAYMAMEAELYEEEDQKKIKNIMTKYDTRIAHPNATHPDLSAAKIDWAIEQETALSYKTRSGIWRVVPLSELNAIATRLRMEMIKDVTALRLNTLMRTP